MTTFSTRGKSLSSSLSSSFLMSCLSCPFSPSMCISFRYISFYFSTRKKRRCALWGGDFYPLLSPLSLNYYICTAPAAKMAGLLRFSTMTTTTKKKHTLKSCYLYNECIQFFYTKQQQWWWNWNFVDDIFVPCVCSRMINWFRSQKIHERASKKICWSSPYLLIIWVLFHSKEILSVVWKIKSGCLIGAQMIPKKVHGGFDFNKSGNAVYSKNKQTIIFFLRKFFLR